MLRAVFVAMLVAVFHADLAEAETKPAPTPTERPRTFYLSSSPGKSDWPLLIAEVKSLPSVKEVTRSNERPAVMHVVFDPHVITPHQVAQAVADAETGHGKHYEATIHFRIPAYADRDEAARIDDIFRRAGAKYQVRIETLDRSVGLFALHFSPLKLDRSKTGVAKQGFSVNQIAHPTKDPPPRGLGLDFILIAE